MESTHTADGATLPAGYFARAATRDDALAVARLRTTYQADAGDPEVVVAEEQLNDWQGLSLDEDTVLIFAPDGSLAAHADLMNRRYVQVSVYGGVHPQHRRQGLGAYLLRWGEAWTHDRMEQAPADAQIAVQHYINTRNEAALALMQAHGYSSAHTVYVMRIEMDAPPMAPAHIEGLRIRSFTPGQDERATIVAVEDAFRDLRDRPPGDFERWLALTENERRQPGLWYLAEDERSSEIVGTCLARIIPGDEGGWVGGVGVRSAWRRRGLALALLRAAFGEFYRRGTRVVTLSVDAGSPTGAPRLYARAGMAVSQSVSIYRKQLRLGRDYSAYATSAGA